MDPGGNVREFFKRHALAGGRVLAAVSGGPDSVALLYLLHGLREELGLSLEVAHLQHGIRGQEALDDARFVAGLAEQLGLPCHSKELELRQAKLAAGRGNLEEMGRIQRYRYFAELARFRNFDAVATGHTLDDQAETLLMRAFRGAARTGLSAMAAARPLERAPADRSPCPAMPTPLLIRPLLDVSRQELLDFLSSHRIAYRTDSSNADPTYLRNWVRLRLMPQLNDRFGAGLARRLSHQAQVLGDEESYLSEEGQRQLERLGEGASLKRGPLLAISKALQRRVIRLWIEARRGHLRGIDFHHVDAVLSLLAGGPAQGRLALPGGWELAREYDRVRLEKKSRPMHKPCFSYLFQAGTQMNIVEAGMTISSSWLDKRSIKLPASSMEAVFTAELFNDKLVVRNYRSGDRLQPLGMSGHKKVKDLFIEKKLPLRLRAVLPMLASGQEILWIPGHARSDMAKVDKTTRRALYLRAAGSLL